MVFMKTNNGQSGERCDNPMSQRARRTPIGRHMIGVKFYEIAENLEMPINGFNTICRRQSAMMEQRVE